MNNILAISTSGPQPSAALLQEGRLAGQAQGAAGKAHSETLMCLVEETLQEAALSVSQIDVFAVDIGPGSFTGVRIGVCAANALAMAWGRPVIGVSSLEALTLGLQGNVCALLDCRNGNGYALLLQDGKKTLPESAVVIQSLLPELPSKTTFVGDGALLHEAEIRSALPNAAFAADHMVSAVKIGMCALGKSGGKEAMPLYLRPSQAERLRGQQEVNG